MFVKQVIALLTVAVLAAGCAAGEPHWARGDATFLVPGISNSG